MSATRLHAAIAAVCPIVGVSIGDANVRETWRIDYAPDATPDQMQAAAGVLNGFNIHAPRADDVREEAQRRIITLTGTQDIIGCLIKQHNAQMRATELTLIQAQGGTWTAEQAAEAAALQSLALQIKAIRAASNVLEPNPPADYTDDKYWP